MGSRKSNFTMGLTTIGADEFLIMAPNYLPTANYAVETPPMPWSATSCLRIQHFKRYEINKIHHDFELDDYADTPRYRNNGMQQIQGET